MVADRPMGSSGWTKGRRAEADVLPASGASIENVDTASCILPRVADYLSSGSKFSGGDGDDMRYGGQALPLLPDSEAAGTAVHRRVVSSVPAVRLGGSAYGGGVENNRQLSADIGKLPPLFLARGELIR